MMIAVLAGGLRTGEIPVKMTHLIVQMSGTDIAAGSFAAKPKVYWRASNRYCRVNEEPDPENAIHGTLIVNEPDVWMVNLVDSTAKHLVDQGPTFNCKLPIFALDPEMAKSKIGELEFGRELEFFRANGAKSVGGPKLQFKANYFELTIADCVLKLVERDDIPAPLLIGVIGGNKWFKFATHFGMTRNRLRQTFSRSRPA
jgi:hypothetical protein